ncbi:hypothetical protein WDW86_09380 [Bdellovibrionota bacterium FG-2]
MTNLWTGFLPPHALIMTQAAPQGAPKKTSYADIVFVGADITGGTPAAQLLDKMIEAMGMKPEQVLRTETLSTPFDAAALPKFVIALGIDSARALLRTDKLFSELRGRSLDYQGTKLRVTFHPAELLETPVLKREAWADLKAVMQELVLSRKAP